MERSHKLDPNKHRSVGPKVSASQPGLVGLRPNFGLLPRFHLSANGGKKYNNDEANHAASSVDQRLSEIVPDGLVKFGPQITIFYALSRYVSLRHSPFFGKFNIVSGFLSCSVPLEIGNYSVLLEKCPVDIYDVDRINWAARIGSLRVGWRFVRC